MSTASSIETIARECVAMRLRLLNRVVTRKYDAALRPLGLRASQINIMVAAWKMGVAGPRQVCEFLDLDPSTLSRNVERMKARGWLEVVPTEDAREQPFRLTTAGQRLLEKAVPRWKVAQQEVRELLGGDVVDRIHNAVERVHRSNPRE